MMALILLGAANGGGSVNGIITSIASGAAGLLAAYSALKISKRDSNVEDLRRAQIEKAELQRQVDDLSDDMLDLRNYVYQMRSAYADKGVQTPEPPTMRSERSHRP